MQRGKGCSLLLLVLHDQRRRLLSLLHPRARQEQLWALLLHMLVQGGMLRGLLQGRRPLRGQLTGSCLLPMWVQALLLHACCVQRLLLHQLALHVCMRPALHATMQRWVAHAGRCQRPLLGRHGVPHAWRRAGHLVRWRRGAQHWRRQGPLQHHALAWRLAVQQALLRVARHAPCRHGIAHADVAIAQQAAGESLQQQACCCAVHPHAGLCTARCDLQGSAQAAGAVPGAADLGAVPSPEVGRARSTAAAGAAATAASAPPAAPAHALAWRQQRHAACSLVSRGPCPAGGGSSRRVMSGRRRRLLSAALLLLLLREWGGNSGVATTVHHTSVAARHLNVWGPHRRLQVLVLVRLLVVGLLVKAQVQGCRLRQAHVNVWRWRLLQPPGQVLQGTTAHAATCKPAVDGR
jgi:hypothetical protein